MRLSYFIILLLLFSHFSFAANPRTESGESFLRELQREQDLLRQQESAKRSQQDEQQVEQLEAEDSSAQKGPCFVINTVEISGVSLISDKKITALYQPSLGECMNQQMINQLLAGINTLYFEKGYITSRAYLPVQKIKTGVLKILVVESKAEKININDHTRSDRWKLWWAMPLQEGDHLRLSDIEQGIDQLNRVSSGNASMKLWPGKSIGTSWIDIVSLPKDEWRGRVAVDNDGNDSTGNTRLRFEFEADNILSINDNWGLYYVGSQDTNALSFNYGMPFRRWTFNYSYSYSEYLSFLTPVVDIFGQSAHHNLNANYLLYRNAKGQLKFMSSLRQRKSLRRVIDVLLEPQHFSSARVGLNQSWRSDYGLWVFDLGYTQGLTAFDSIEDIPDLPDAFPKAQFSRVDGAINLFASLPAQMGYVSSFRFQYSDDSLYSSDQIHMGDRATVRGFQGSLISGDNGAYWRNELNGYFTYFYRGGEGFLGGVSKNLVQHTQWYSFLDGGVARDQANDKRSDIVGSGVGVRYSYGGFSLDCSWAMGLHSSEDWYKNSHVFYLNTSLKLF